jgi:hypothetical protein
MHMFGIPLVDIRVMSLARSALPDAPVIEDEPRRKGRGGRRRQTR